MALLHEGCQLGAGTKYTESSSLLFLGIAWAFYGACVANLCLGQVRLSFLNHSAASSCIERNQIRLNRHINQM